MEGPLLVALRLGPGYSSANANFRPEADMAIAKLIPAAAIAAAVLVAGALPAAAKCTKLGFSVNDYGKEGPTRDAKALLDKYIADWAAQNGIKKYTTGKKDVTCELFLDFGFFDEHTCKATATVCWGEGGQSAAAPAGPADQKGDAAPKVKAKKVEAPKAGVSGAAAAPGEAARTAPAPAAKPAAATPAKAPPPIKGKDPS